MERDFMGLSAKAKQEEDPEEIIDSARGQSSKMQWTFSNKGSAQQFLSLHSSNNEKPKTGFEALASNGLVSITTIESADTSHNPFSNIMQKQGGNDYTGTTTFLQKSFDSLSLHRPAEERKLHVATPLNQTVSLGMSCHVHKSSVSSTVPYLTGSRNTQPIPANLIGSTNTQLLPVTTSVPGKSTSNPVVGTTELRNTSRISGAPAQLTIFYAGSVCVYEDVSPEMAQAIMLLAGNESSANSNVAVTTSPTQMPTVRPSTINRFAENQNHVAIPCFSSAISVTSISSSQSPGGSANCDDAAAVRTIRTPNSTPHFSKGNMPIAVNSSGPMPLTVLSSGSAVPQFRKASLARFLEKRKERVLSASPYSNDNKQSKEGSYVLPTAS